MGKSMYQFKLYKPNYGIPFSFFTFYGVKNNVVTIMIMVNKGFLMKKWYKKAVDTLFRKT